VLSERSGLQRVTVDAERAYVLTALTGPVAVGDAVVVNTTAVDLGLGTGGWHVVHWNLARDRWNGAGGGHVLKLRYTSLQADTGVAEETVTLQGSDLGAMPVVACCLHSQVGVVAAAYHDAGGTGLVYVMTDGGALPLALSDLVAELVGAGLLAGTVSAGHAFGGTLEAVNVPSALTLARHALSAQAVVIGRGPGVVGTGTSLGNSGMEVAPTLDAAAALGGRPIVCVRASSADSRERHRGISHHTTTALDLVRSSVLVPLPTDLDPALPDRHEMRRYATPDVAALLAGAGVTVTSMGREPGDDPLFFASAAAAGMAAAGLVPAPPVAGDGR